MEQNTGLLAGCLGLQNALHVWDLLLKDKYARPILTEWAQHAKNQFGTQLLSMAFEDEFQSIIFGDDRPVVDGLKVTNATIAPLTCLRYVVQLMAAKPHLFRNSSVKGVTPSLNPYDVLHGWKLLAWARRQHGTTTQKPHSTPAIAPWNYEPTVAGSASDQAPAETPASTGSTTGSSTGSWGMTAEELCEIWDAIDVAAVAQAADGNQTGTNRQHARVHPSRRGIRGRWLRYREDHDLSGHNL
ncbi:hypothetical protein AWENTII_007891 [Aspergillus wentii]